MSPIQNNAAIERNQLANHSVPAVAAAGESLGVGNTVSSCNQNNAMLENNAGSEQYGAGKSVGDSSSTVRVVYI